MDVKEVTSITTLIEEIKRVIKRPGKIDVEEEDSQLTEWELCRKYSKTRSMEQD